MEDKPCHVNAQQQQGAQREAGAARLQNSLPRKTVRRLAGDQKEQDAGQKLCQPHHAGTRPRSSGRCVSAYTCQATATACISDAVVVSTRSVR
jgi:hypothetical protein